jgi:Protein of unknown function (DUF2934)
MAIKTIRTITGKQGSADIAEEPVKVAAYYIWEKEGRPDGENLRHWYLAIAELSSNGISSPPTRVVKKAKITKISSGRPRKK